ncbi:MAG: AMP-binding protein, partial [Planctomycetota bacterium]
MNEQHLIEFLLRRATDAPSRLAIVWPSLAQVSGATKIIGPTGYHHRTWSELAADVWSMTEWLASQSVQPGERVVHVAENRYEWILTDLALLALGAVHVPLHT